MSRTRHTPGPWEDNNAGLIYGQVSGDDDEAPFVCDVCNEPGSGEYTEQEKANAALIAAAPDLLQALQTCAHYLYRFYAQAIDRENDPRFMLEWAAIRLAWSAIDKAKGGAS